MFHASFDQGIDADFALGEAKLKHAPSGKASPQAKVGLPEQGSVKHQETGGVHGGFLLFETKEGPNALYHADKNFPPLNPDWSATVSFWLLADPENGLREGFCDPIQVTSKKWSDAAMFVEFEKRASGIPFRLGVYADKNIWNPTGREISTIPSLERPLAPVEKPPFRAGKWTHVLFTVEHFNTDKEDGVAKLYLDGEKAAELSPRKQTFTWNPEEASISLGLGYNGGMDELSIFNRALSAEEVKEVFKLPEGIKSIRESGER